MSLPLSLLEYSFPGDQLRRNSLRLIYVNGQSCYNNSPELLFAAMSLYQLRIIERLWGSRKFAVHLSRLSRFLKIHADIYLVFPIQRPPTNPPPPSNHHNHAPSPHIWRRKSPPRRSYAPHLRPSRSIPRRDTYSLQVPHRHFQVPLYILQYERRPRTSPQR